MKSKKNEARFTIKFNPVNPRHRKAIEFLNRVGRGKAALIADALCEYARYEVDISDDLLGLGTKEVVQNTQEVKEREIFGISKSDDDILDILANSVDQFFD